MDRYEKSAHQIIERSRAKIEEKKHRGAIIRRSVYTVSGICALLITGFGIWHDTDIKNALKRNDSFHEPNDLVSTDTTQHYTETTVSDYTTKEQSIQTTNISSSETFANTSAGIETTTKQNDTVSEILSSETVIKTTSAIESTVVSSITTALSSADNKPESEKTSTEIVTTKNTETIYATEISSVKTTSETSSRQTATTVFITTTVQTNTNPHTTAASSIATTNVIPSSTVKTTVQTSATDGINTTAAATEIPEQTANDSCPMESPVGTTACNTDSTTCVSTTITPGAEETIGNNNTYKYITDDNRIYVAYNGGYTVNLKYVGVYLGNGTLRYLNENCEEFYFDDISVYSVIWDEKNEYRIAEIDNRLILLMLVQE